MVSLDMVCPSKAIWISEEVIWLCNLVSSVIQVVVFCSHLPLFSSTRISQMVDSVKAVGLLLLLQNVKKIGMYVICTSHGNHQPPKVDDSDS